MDMMALLAVVKFDQSSADSIAQCISPHLINRGVGVRCRLRRCFRWCSCLRHFYVIKWHFRWVLEARQVLG